MSGGTQQATAEESFNIQTATASRYGHMAEPLLKELIAYSQGAIAGGEPGYVKKGFADYGEMLREKSRSTSTADFRSAFAPGRAPQGGAALGEIGALSAGGGGREAGALSQNRLNEANTMFQHTQALFDAMSGQGSQGIAQGTQAGAVSSSALAGMRQYNPITADILSALGIGASVYGALGTGGVAGVSTGAGAYGPSSYGIGAGYSPEGLFG